MKKIFLFLMIAGLPLLAQAQRSDGRWVLGGSLGMGFSNSQTSLNIGPQIGYRLTDYLTTGGGISYTYYKYKNFDAKSNYLGMNLYARLNPIPYIQLFIQPEIYRRWGKTAGVKDESVVFGTLLAGGGVMIPVIQGGIVVSVYYDLLQNKHSPYRDEWMYSIGYAFYF